MKDSYNPERDARFNHPSITGFSLPAWQVFIIVLLSIAAISSLIHTNLHGAPSLVFYVVTVFLSLNLLVCYWEFCLFLRRDYVEQRFDYWRKRQEATGKDPAWEFLTTRVNGHNLFSATYWSDCWPAYAQYDKSYADRRSYGFNIDVGNGFTTLIPSIIIHLGITFECMPARILGIVGAMCFWQAAVGTFIYWQSFFIAGRHKQLNRRQMMTYIWGTNTPWVLMTAFGIYMSVRLILDDNFNVLNG